ncbi:hypothetical protein [Teichococcus coralli]|uniref:hypothetical protein n=1 Tax=Teichococcus coralli TaxID=2545983 RepID=UPI001925B4C5|nr:hypothetical protein [Pseudoroseomonas coralli]
MEMRFTTTVSTDTAGSSAGRLAIPGDAWARLRHQLRCHRERQGLLDMDDRMLRDIGPDRCRARRERRKWWWQA